MREVMLLRILGLVGMATYGRGAVSASFMSSSSTVILLGMKVAPTLSIVLSNNNKRGGSFSNRAKSNLPSLNVSM